MKEEEEESKLFENVPLILVSPVTMLEPNQQIMIFEGTFVIKSDIKEFKIIGKVYFDWYPTIETRFSGIVNADPRDIANLIKNATDYKIIVNELNFGNCMITHINTTNFSLESEVAGALSHKAILGDKSISVDKIKFAVPNLRSFHGYGVKKQNNESFSMHKNRLILENDEYLVKIDKVYNYNDLQKTLEVKGGYIIMYAGEMTRKSGNISYEDFEEVVEQLDHFLYFINGRRASAMFIQGLFQDSEIWFDYSNYFIDPFKSVYSWPPRHSIDGLNELWKFFSTVCKKTDDRNFLITAIHWYIETNSNSGFSEGSIIMAQAALELIYNWLIIEKNKIITGRDSENISASNKLRLILSHIEVDFNIPNQYSDLKDYASSNKIADAPTAIVEIRNSIVHSQLEKRRKMIAIPPKVKHEALQLSILYIELALLYILEYNGKYYNRASKSEQKVPWVKSD